MNLRALGRRIVFSRAFPSPLRDTVVDFVRRRRERARPRTLARAITPGPCRICSGSLSQYRDNGHVHAAAYKTIYAELFVCADCGHKQFLPDLKDSVIADVYSQGYWANDDEPKFYAQLYKSEHNDTVRELLDIAARHGVVPPFRLHEFGCGTGLTVHHLRRRGVEATGSDWSPISTEFAKEQGNTHIFRENANTPKQMAGERLDAIFTNHVLEHLPDPVTFLAGLKQMMQPGAIVIMRLPSGDALIDRNLGLPFDPLYYFPHHIHYFSPRSLATAAERAGFKVLDLRATTRVVPELLNAAQGQNSPVTLHARIAEAAERYDTEELEIVFALPDSPRPVLDSVAKAKAVPVFMGRPRQPLAYSNYEDFYRKDTCWSYAYVEAGDTVARPMFFNEVSNDYYFNTAAIGDQWLQAAPDGPHPQLIFTAPETGRYFFEVEAAARFINSSDIGLTISGAGRTLRDLVLTSSAPQIHLFEVELQAGQTVTFSAHTVPGQGGQRATCLVGVRKSVAAS